MTEEYSSAIVLLGAVHFGTTSCQETIMNPTEQSLHNHLKILLREVVKMEVGNEYAYKIKLRIRFQGAGVVHTGYLENYEEDTRLILIHDDVEQDNPGGVPTWRDAIPLGVVAAIGHTLIRVHKKIR